jgi:hypothetical protein
MIGVHLKNFSIVIPAKAGIALALVFRNGKSKSKERFPPSRE